MLLRCCAAGQSVLGSLRCRSVSCAPGLALPRWTRCFFSSLHVPLAPHTHDLRRRCGLPSAGTGVVLVFLQTQSWPVCCDVELLRMEIVLASAYLTLTSCCPACLHGTVVICTDLPHPQHLSSACSRQLVFHQYTAARQKENTRAMSVVFTISGICHLGLSDTHTNSALLSLRRSWLVRSR